ncbi:DUF2971 domain-containing protein [Erwinia sp. S63]|uniref:DUF2971 domain-containing protein n=1 Tax=Erwinia sp. S63 TaxID=2769341 RepID=UPI00190D9453|nr:DUF2971 domain-containing protein [Erwinia sp. S63]MBK0097467.1 DUF2971 domain-containing protein [Erwinia sp. S63]
MIYHYTDLNAVKLIFEKNKLWLTDHRFLNDTEESKCGYKIIKDTLLEFSDFPLNYPQDLISDIKNSLIFLGDNPELIIEPPSIFVASFSKDKDSLSQWRSYGMHAIGIDENTLKTEIERHGDTNIFLKCHYITNNKESVNYAISIIKSFLLPLLLSAWVKLDDKNILGHLYLYLIIYSMGFKHAGFRDESEVRIIIASIWNDERIKFRTRGDYLIPYWELDIPQQALREIVIGPVEDRYLAETSLQMFANSIVMGRLKSGNDKNRAALEVRCSEIPFRSI